MDEFKKYTILYIEDDEGVRTINSRFLNRMFNELYEKECRIFTLFGMMTDNEMSEYRSVVKYLK